MPIYVACPSAILLSSLRTQELAFSRRIWNHPETGLGVDRLLFRVYLPLTIERRGGNPALFLLLPQTNPLPCRTGPLRWPTTRRGWATEAPRRVVPCSVGVCALPPPKAEKYASPGNDGQIRRRTVISGGV